MPAQNVFQGHVLTPGEHQQIRLDREAQQQELELRRLTVQAAMEDRKAKLDAAKQQQQDEQLWGETVKRHIVTDEQGRQKPDYDSAISELYGIAPHIAEAKKQEVLKFRTAGLDGRRKELEADKLEVETDVDAMRRMVDESAFRVLFPKLSPKAQQLIGPQFNPERIKQIADAGMKDASKTEQLRALLDKDLRGFFLQSLLDANDPETVADIAEGIDGMYGPKQGAIFRKSVGDPLTPEGKARLQALIGEAQQGKEPFSDYGRFETDFLEAEAAKLGKKASDLTPAQRVQFKAAARKQFGQADDAARRPLAPIVIMTPSGPMVTQGSDRTHVTPIIGPDGQPLPLAPTAAMRDKVEGRKLVARSITEIKAIGDTIIKSVGPSQRMDALKRGAASVFGNDPKFKTYQDARMALAGNLAVGQQGSRPSDADIRAIWLPLVPDPYTDTKDSAEMKWNLIRSMSNVDALSPGGTAKPLTAEELIKKYGGK